MLCLAAFHTFPSLFLCGWIRWFYVIHYYHLPCVFCDIIESTGLVEQSTFSSIILLVVIVLIIIISSSTQPASFLSLSKLQWWWWLVLILSHYIQLTYYNYYFNRIHNFKRCMYTIVTYYEVHSIYYTFCCVYLRVLLVV